MVKKTTEEIKEEVAQENEATEIEQRSEPKKEEASSMLEAGPVKDASKTESVKSQPLIYLGPNLPDASLRQNTIFVSEPVWLKPIFDRCSAIKGLLVPTTQTAQVRNAIKVPGTRENALYQEVQKFIKEAKEHGI